MLPILGSRHRLGVPPGWGEYPKSPPAPLGLGCLVAVTRLRFRELKLS